MNLLVAPEEVPTVVDVRRGRRDGLGRRIGAGHLRAQRQAVAGVRIHEPDPHPVPVGRRRAIRAPWLTAVFDVDPEHHAPPVALAVGHRVVPRPREADLVGRRAPRLGPADAVVWIARHAHHAHRVRVFRTGEAGALQAVEAARVEVAVQPLLNVPHMRPFAGDARGVCHERRRDPDRRAHLTSMRGVDRRARTGVGRARVRRAGIAEGVIRAARVHSPATGHPTGEYWHAARRFRGNWCRAIREGPVRVALLARTLSRHAGRSVPVEAASRRVAALLTATVGDTTPGAHLGAFLPRARRLVVEAPPRPAVIAPRHLALGVETLPGAHLSAGQSLARPARRLVVEAPPGIIAPGLLTGGVETFPSAHLGAAASRARRLVVEAAPGDIAPGVLAGVVETLPGAYLGAAAPGARRLVVEAAPGDIAPGDLAGVVERLPDPRLGA